MEGEAGDLHQPVLVQLQRPQLGELDEDQLGERGEPVPVKVIRCKTQNEQTVFTC